MEGPESSSLLDTEAAQVFLNQIISVFIEPEVARRHERGQLDVPVALQKGQVVFYADSRAPVVRLNDEVRAKAQMLIQAKTDKVAGSPIYADEVQGVASIQLTNEDDPNSGHVTFMLIGDHYHIAFDFIYNRARAQRLVALARQFFDVAKYAEGLLIWAPLVDNLFAAVELAVKALLWTNAYGSTFSSRMSHGHLHSAFNLFAKHGNVPTTQSDMFNALMHARPNARYGVGHIVEDWAQASLWITYVEELIVRTECTISVPEVPEPSHVLVKELKPDPSV